MSNRAAIYVRLSEEDRDKKLSCDESESIQNQKSMLVSFCVERGWDIFNIYCDEDYSGADRNRPGFNAMIKDCEEGKVNIVVCKTQSRFSRDMEIIEKYIHGKFLEWRVRFISIVDHADTEVKGNKKARQINGLINEWYLEDLSDNIRRTLNHKKQNGEWTGAFAPYGYIRDPNNKNHMAVDEEAAEVVREIFGKFANGAGYYSIAKELNDRGTPNPTAHKRCQGVNLYSRSLRAKVTSTLWRTDTIAYILRKEEYIGTLCQNKTENLSYKSKKRVKRGEEDWTKTVGAHEAIVDVAMWKRVQEKLATRTRPHNKTGKRHIFAGKVFCGVCKNSMMKNATPSRTYLKCRTVHKAVGNCANNKQMGFDLLEEIVLSEINRVIADYYNPEIIDIEGDAAESKTDKLLKEKSKLNAQIDENNRVIELLYFDRANGDIPDEQFFQISKSRQADIDSIKSRISQIDIEIEAVGSGSDDAELKERLISKYSSVDTLTEDVVEEFIKAIYIGEFVDKFTLREVRIVWSFST